MLKSFTTTKGESLMLDRVENCFLGVYSKPISYKKGTIVRHFQTESAANSWFYRLKKKLN